MGDFPKFGHIFAKTNKLVHKNEFSTIVKTVVD